MTELSAPQARRTTTLLASFVSLAVVTLVSPETRAQAPYTVTVADGNTYNVLPMGVGTDHAPVTYQTAGDPWDEGVATIPLPWTVFWYGKSYNTLYAYTNGFVSFEPPPSGVQVLGPPLTVPSPSNRPHNFIAPMWTNLTGKPGGTPSIRSIEIGVSPNRSFVVQYDDFVAFNLQFASDAKFQIQFDEFDQSIRILYGPSSGIIASTAGLENDVGTLGGDLLQVGGGCDGTCACTPRNCGAATNFVDGRVVTLSPPQQADLIGSVDGPTGAYPGNNFQVNYTVSNVGLAAAAATSAEIRISTDTTIDGSDTLLTTVPIAALQPQTNASGNVQVMMPALPVDAYYLGIIVDSTTVVTEADETNNTEIDPKGIVTGPDLTALQVNAPTSSGPGETMDIQLEVVSIGAPVMTPIEVELYLSEDTMLGAGDTLLDTISVTLPDGFSDFQTVQVTIPLGQAPSPPSYRVLAFVDSDATFAETVETNNVVASSGLVTLIPPNLTFVDEGSVDGADVAFRGLPYPVTLEIANLGGTVALDFRACILLSQNSLITPNGEDTEIYRSPLLSLPSTQSQLIRVEPIIDANLAPGTWYLGAAVDCDGTVQEASETDNTAIRGGATPVAITVMDPAPDFVVLDLMPPASAAAGETIPLAVRLANEGVATGAAHLRFVLTTDRVIDATDVVIFETQTPVSIDAARETTVSYWGDVPSDLPSGNYHLGVVIDPAGDLTEVVESNNEATAGPFPIAGSDLAIISPTPPNAVVGVPYVWRFFAIGATGDYQWSARWNGASPAGLSFDAATAELSGTAAEADLGQYELIVDVTSGQALISTTYTFRVTPPQLPLTVISGRLPPALKSESYTAQIIAVGGQPAYRWRVLDAADLPAGLTVELDGRITGRPSTLGAFSFSVEVTDDIGATSVGQLAVDVIDPEANISIDTADIPSALVGRAYNTGFSATGGTVPYRWVYDGDTIPGLEFEPGQAPRLTGTPTVAGVYAFTIQARDARGLFDRNAYVLEVFELGELTITTGDTAETQMPEGVIDTPYLREDESLVRFEAELSDGSVPPNLSWMVVGGGLPTGLSLDTRSGELSGTPTEAGVFAFTMMAVDSTGDFDRQTFTIVIENPADRGPGDGGGCACVGTSHSRLTWLLLLGAPLVMRRRIFGALGRRDRTWLRTAGVLPLLFVVFASSARAATPYRVSELAVPYVPLSSPTMISPGLGDGGSEAIDLPFDVRLYGVPYRRIWINANGFISVATIGTGFHVPPSTNPNASVVPNGFVAPLWSDWCASASGTCSSPAPAANIGVGYRVHSSSVTIEWSSLSHYDDFTAASQVSFQAVLYAGPEGRIDLNYGPVVVGTDGAAQPTALDARIGVESALADEGLWLGPCAGAERCTTAEVSSLAGRQISLSVDPGRDLSVSAVTVPTAAYRGLDVTIGAQLASAHDQTLGPFTYAIYLAESPPPTVPVQTQVFTSAPLVLAPFETRLIETTFTMPANQSLGTYRVGVVVDVANQVSEDRENNNVAESVQVMRINEPAPDIASRSVRALSDNARPGDTIDVTYAVENVGAAADPVTVQLYLSANRVITIADVPLGAPLSLSLPTGATQSGTVSTAIPSGLASGAYHLGMIADPNGAISELDETNNQIASSSPIQIASDTVTFSTIDLPPAVLTQPYAARIEVTGGFEPLTVRAVGALPRGFSFVEATSELRGIPLEAGRFDVEFEAVSESGVEAQKTYVIDVTDPALPLTILSDRLPAAVLGSDYDVRLLAAGGRAPRAWRASALPPGLNLSVDGELFGTPVEPGLFEFDAEVIDADGALASRVMSLDVLPAGNLQVVTTQLPAASLGEYYEQALLAVGGVGARSWSAIDALPPGLELTEGGLVRGTPTMLADSVVGFGFRVEVRAGLASDTNRIGLFVRPGRQTVEIATEALRSGLPGEEYSAALIAQGGRPPYVWQIIEGEGSLPPGFSAAPDGDSLVISGRFENEGVWTFNVRVTDQQGVSAERPFSLIAANPVGDLDEGCGCSTSPWGSERAAAFAWLALGLLLVSRRRD